MLGARFTSLVFELRQVNLGTASYRYGFSINLDHPAMVREECGKRRLMGGSFWTLIVDESLIR